MPEKTAPTPSARSSVATRKVKILRRSAIAPKYDVGQTVELPARVAGQLIGARHAEPAGRPKPETADAPQGKETADAPTPAPPSK